MHLLTPLLRKPLAACLVLCAAAFPARSQGIHFSQFFNAPLLVSAANTGLMSDDDYRIGLQYRTQWGAVPVPFNTLMAAGDIQVFRRKNGTNWLGLGAVLFTDRAGEGSLSMTRLQLNAAYHLSLSEKQLLSLGLGVASINRKVNFSDLMFDAQWDGYEFNTSMANREPVQGNRSGYMDVSAGVNYSFFPTERVYIKATVGIDHVNSPAETFFEGGNQVKPRTHAMIDARLVLSNGSTLVPTVYYSTQHGAWEALFGASMVLPVRAQSEENKLILGLYHRLRDAIVVVAGYEYKQLRVTASYDYTVSDIGQYISHSGGFEIGLGFRGAYSSGSRGKSMQCPRF